MNVHPKIISQLAAKGKAFEPTAEAFARSRFMLRSSEYGDNEEEMKALEDIANGIKCRVESTEEGLSLAIDYEYEDPGDYLSVIEDGMSAPLTGGNNGVVTNPDGSTKQSEVPPELWGNPIEEYSEAGSEIKDEIDAMIADLFVSYVETLVSESRSEIAEIAKQHVQNELRKII